MTAVQVLDISEVPEVIPEANFPFPPSVSLRVSVSALLSPARSGTGQHPPNINSSSLLPHQATGPPRTMTETRSLFTVISEWSLRQSWF